MTTKQRAEEFVNKYPAMFAEDQWWWIGVIEIELLKAQKDAIKELQDKEVKNDR